MAKKNVNIEVFVRTYAGLILVGGFALGLLVMGFVSAQSALKVFEERKKLEDQLAGVNEKIVELEVLASGELEIYKQIAEKALPDNKPVFKVFDTLNYIAEDTGISIKELSTSPGSISTASAIRNNNIGGAESISVTLAIQGKYEDFREFVLKIAKTNPLIDINEVRVSPKDDEEDNFLVGEMDLSYYWMPDQKTSLNDNIKAYQLSQASRVMIEEIKNYDEYTNRSLIISENRPGNDDAASSSGFVVEED